MTVTYQPAHDQTPDATALCAPTTVCYVGMETFNSWNGSSSFSTDFPALLTVGGPTGGIQGDYAGSLTRSSNFTYGGAGGSGYYPTVTDDNYLLTLTTLGDVPGVNYFGLWFSALDGGNQLQFYEGSTLLYTFTPAMFQTLVGACPGSAFCGNPNNGKDAGEQFADVVGPQGRTPSRQGKSSDGEQQTTLGKQFHVEILRLARRQNCLGPGWVPARRHKCKQTRSYVQ